MRREADAATILRRLLERHERRSSDRRVIERPAQAFDDPAGLRMLVETLEEAQRRGAVELVWDRDAPHLVSRVILLDPDRLYALTGRTPAADVSATALQMLDGIDVSTETARQLHRDFAAAWLRGGKLVGIGAGDSDAARTLIKATDAAFTELEGDTPLRTRSARLLGDSKALESAIPSLLAYLRQAGLIDGELSRGEALEQLGLTKFAQPVLAAGPLVIHGLDIDGWPYAGVPPELVALAKPAAAVRSVLTIENLESFNRHVRSCRLPGDVVVYTGGFPATPVLTLLRAVIAVGVEVVHHWGDVDPGGVRIGRHLETALGAPISPHLMDVETARCRGQPARPGQLAPALPVDTAFYALAEYLQDPDALWLEQEVIDPVPVLVS